MVGQDSEMLTRFGSGDELSFWSARGDDGYWRLDAVAQKPSFGDFTGGNDLVNAVVIEVGVLRDSEPDVASGERRHVVGVPVVQRVVGGHDGDLVAFGPT